MTPWAADAPRGSRTCLDDGPAHSLVGDERGGRAAGVGGEGVAAARDPREQEGEEREEDEEEEEKGGEEEQCLQPHGAAPSGLREPRSAPRSREQRQGQREAEQLHCK